MLRVRTGSAKFGWAALLALLLAIRTVTSAGYMSAVEHGRLTLMLCPDGEWTPPAAAMPGMAGMGGMGGDHAPKSTHHQQCPYAAAAATPFAGTDSLPLLLLPLLLFALLAASAPPALIRRTRFERPFSTGPPLPA